MSIFDNWADDEGMTKVFWQCASCLHFGVPLNGRPTCAAFEQEIPQPILDDKHDHRTPFDGDQGIRYSRKADTAFENLFEKEF